MTPRIAILNEIDARLKTISIANGYLKDIAKVVRAVPPLTHDEEYPAIYYFPIETEPENPDQNGVLFENFFVGFSYVDVYGDENKTDKYEIIDEMTVSIETCLVRKTTSPHLNTGTLDPSLNCLIDASTTNNGMITKTHEPFVKYFLDDPNSNPLIVGGLIIVFSHKVNKNNKFLAR